MTDDPTYAEVKGLLEQMECCMISSKHSSAPESFELVWRHKLHEYAFSIDCIGKRALVLRQTRDNEFTWVVV